VTRVLKKTDDGMIPHEQPINEQRAFDQLLGDDGFDDSVCDEHQSDLRSELLRVFDQLDRDVTVAELSVRPTRQRQQSSWSRSLGYATVLAVCLIGFVVVWFYAGSQPHTIVEHAPVADSTDDARLLASLAAVNAFKDEVPLEDFFGALAMCQQDHEGRKLSIPSDDG